MNLLNTTKQIYRAIVPIKFRKTIGLCRLYFTNQETYKQHQYWRMKKKYFGKLNPDKTFYVLRKYPIAMGLLSCYLTYLGQLELVNNNNYIPVVDMKTHYYSGLHNSSDEIEKINAWELYFEPLSNYTIEEVYNSKNVILGYGFTTENTMLFFNEHNISKEDITRWSALNNKYIKLIAPLQDRFENINIRILKGKRVLGVMIREGYMLLAHARDNSDSLYNLHPGIQNHPVQPSIDQLLSDIERRMKEWNCDHIFVSAETSYIINIMRDRFGPKVLYTSRLRRETKEFTLKEFRNAYLQNSSVISVEQKNDDYLEEIYLLSRCTCLLSGKCSGSVVAAIWNNNSYERMEFYDLGLY